MVDQDASLLTQFLMHAQDERPSVRFRNGLPASAGERQASGKVPVT
jgi:hypothetical protein